jgi:phosphonate transport system ATP-binding protein
MSSGNADNAVQLQNVWFSYEGRNYALQDISLNIKSASSTVIVGSSGSGKTTLLKIINGLLKPQQGSVRVFGTEISDEQKRIVRRSIGYIPQQLGLLRNSTVLQNVLVGGLARMGSASAILGIYPEHEIQHAMRCIEQVGIGHKTHERVYRLSGGERQRVAIARALMQKPSIILADEFTSDLDYVTAHEMLDLMGEIRRNGVTLILVTHNLELAAQHGEKIVFLKGGMKIAESHSKDVTEETMKTLV